MRSVAEDGGTRGFSKSVRKVCFPLSTMAAQIKLDRDLPPEVAAKAVKELRETPEVTAPAIQQLRKLVEEDKTLHYITTDEMLIRYLRPNKYYAESAYALVSNPLWFSER